MEIQLDRIHQRAPDLFQTCQPNRHGRGGTLTPNNDKWSLPLQILSKVQHTSIKGRMGRCSACFQFYDGLPERLKDRIALLRKPDTLRELVQATVRHNNLYWEHQDERKRTRQQQPPRNTTTRQTQSDQPPDCPNEQHLNPR